MPELRIQMGKNYTEIEGKNKGRESVEKSKQKGRRKKS